VDAPSSCYARNYSCRLANDLFNFILKNIIPITIMLLFGYLIVDNVRKQICLVAPATLSTTKTTVSRIRRDDYQLIRLLLIQVCLMSIFVMPAGIIKLYLTLTVSYMKQKSQLRITIENFCFTLAVILSYVTYSMPFYIDTLSGSTFRYALRRLFTRVY
ncbi:unnamed protein product, partial [Didymodactylos carnosus]